MSIISADVADFSEGGNIIEDCSAFVNGTAMLACTEVDDLVIGTWPIFYVIFTFRDIKLIYPPWQCSVQRRVYRRG